MSVGSPSRLPTPIWGKRKKPWNHWSNGSSSDQPECLGSGWIPDFDRRGNRDWSFFGETCDDEGRPTKVWLYYAKSTPIKRHVKVKGEANPYDPTYETYFEEREGAHMLETFRGTRTLRYLWYEQRGLCTQCNTKITRITGWRLHYCVPRVKGGSTGATNCVLLHPECHDRVHRQRLPVSKPRLL